MFRTAFLPISLIFCLACSDTPEKTETLPYYNSPDFTPIFLESEREADQKINHRIRNFSFTDQTGKQITGQDMAGKIHVANFIFTSCGSICPVMTRHMKRVQEAFRGNSGVVLLSYSVTPWIDTVGKLKEFADKNGIDSKSWHLLTGSQGDIYALARQSYFAEEDLGFNRDSTEFLHTEHVLLIDGNKRIRGIYNGTLQLEAEQLIRDIRTLARENAGSSPDL